MMKKGIKLLLIVLLWISIAIILYKMGFLSTDSSNFVSIIKGNYIEMQILFVFISTMRVLIFIPQTVFILIGSVIFGPYTSFILSLLALFFSQSIIYFIGVYFNKNLLKDNWISKNPSIIELVKTYSYKILALGIICPVTPSDLITATAGYINLGYKKCISLIVLVDAPLIFLYGFLGSGLTDASWFKLIALLILLLISYYSFMIWRKIKSSIQ